jgi:hypothetical protein
MAHEFGIGTLYYYPVPNSVGFVIMHLKYTLGQSSTSELIECHTTPPPKPTNCFARHNNKMGSTMTKEEHNESKPEEKVAEAPPAEEEVEDDDEPDEW